MALYVYFSYKNVRFFFRINFPFIADLNFEIFVVNSFKNSSKASRWKWFRIETIIYIKILNLAHQIEHPRKYKLVFTFFFIIHYNHTAINFCKKKKDFTPFVCSYKLQIKTFMFL